jgi:hypothetical protein
MALVLISVILRKLEFRVGYCNRDPEFPKAPRVFPLTVAPCSSKRNARSWRTRYSRSTSPLLDNTDSPKLLEIAMIPDPSTYVAPENRVHQGPWKVRCTSPLTSGTRTSRSSLVSFRGVTLTPSNT